LGLEALVAEVFELVEVELKRPLASAKLAP
jgi:hypothetical protein